jgi:GNAT superfamily N-acetyltransferase
MSLTVEPVTGRALSQALPALARLRIEIFRDFPYLYDGNLAYEEAYLTKFSAAPDALIVVASDSGTIVGASTAAPMRWVASEFASPFDRQGYDIDRIFYFGESVLLPAYRGQGIGHAFFDQRELHARKLSGYEMTAFCAVVRPADHPLKPADYRPLDAFWTTRGYAKVPGLLASFDWKDVDKSRSDGKLMQFWLRAI